MELAFVGSGNYTPAAWSYSTHEFKHLTDLKSLRDSGRSRQTSNHYFRSIQQFTLWLVKSKRLVENPLSEMRKLNTQLDRRHDRRALTDEEFARLIAAAESGKPDQRIPGPDRAMLYILAASTGYRRSELASLTPSSFNLDADPPTATVAASFSKRKRIDTQVLHPNLVERLRGWLAAKALPPNAILFSVSDKVPGGVDRRTSEMMMNDLTAARAAWIAEAKTDKEKELREQSDFLKYKDSQNRFADFHANRHTFITNLSKANVSPKVAQELARHSDIRLTLGIYTHTNLEEKQRAVQSLPSLWEHIGSKPEAETGSERLHAAQPDRDKTAVASDLNTVKSERGDAFCPTCHAVTPAASYPVENSDNGHPRLWRPKDDLAKPCIFRGLLNETSSLGVSGEYPRDNPCPCLSLIDDTELQLLVQSWKQLPSAVRDTILSIVRYCGSSQNEVGSLDF